MRGTIIFLGAITLAGMSAAQAVAEEVEVKGLHICCVQCVRITQGWVSTVDGVSNAKADQKAKTLTFTAKDKWAAQAVLKALYDGGYYGTATIDGKELSVPLPKGEGKADKIELTNVQACCGDCYKAIRALFKDAKVSFDGTGSLRTVVIEGQNLDCAEVLATLRKAGFNGTPK